MMFHMTDQHVDQSPGADRCSAGGTQPEGGLIADVIDEDNVCAAQKFKLIDQITEREIIKPCFADIMLLLKAWEWSLVIA